MKIIIAGGGGFLGQPLSRALAADGREVVVLTRRPSAPPVTGKARFVTWSPESVGAWAAEIDSASAVVNLAGESIADRRWSNQQKERILDSRVRATRVLAE